MPTTPAVPGPAARLLLWAGVALAALGVVLERMWTHWVMVRSVEHAKLAALALLFALPLVLWRRLPWATVVAALFVAAAVWFTGPLPMLACVLLLAAAFALGSTLVDEATPARGAVAVVIGLGLLAAAVGWTLPLPVHLRAVYAAVLLALCAWRWRALHAAMRAALAGPHAALELNSWAALFAALVVGLATTGAWLPSVQFDDLALHLSLPRQLLEDGVYRLDPRTSVWALTAWTGDVLQGIAQVLAGGEARGALDLAWLALSLRLLWSLAESLGLDARLRWLCLAVFASQPLLACLLGGAQTEGPTTAVLFALALVVQRGPAEPHAAMLRTFALLCGVALALKVSNVLLAGPCALWLLARWRGRLPWRALPMSILLVAFVCGSSYAYSAWLTGNPVLPLFNGVFHSPFYPPVNFSDLRWHVGFDWRLPWRIVFRTGEVYEGWPGAAGFTLIALAGAAIWALFERSLRPLALVALAGIALPLSQLQYLRYAYPAASLLVPVAIAAAQRGAGRHALSALLVALAGLNVAFQVNSTWILHEGAERDLVGHGRAAVEARFAPERALADGQRAAADANRRVTLFADPLRPFAAELAGHAITVAWYDPEMAAARVLAEADGSGQAWRALFARAGATHVVVVTASASPALRAALADATRERIVSEVELWRLPPRAASAPSLLEQRDMSPWR